MLRKLLPRAELVIIDGVEDNLAIARRFLGDSVSYERAWFSPRQRPEFDVVIVPLAYRGDREALYRDPPARCLLVHDWIWRRRGEGATVSILLGKRINRVRAPLLGNSSGIPANGPVASDALMGVQ